MKKVMAIILTIALVVMVCPAVFAEEAIDENNLNNSAENAYRIAVEALTFYNEAIYQYKEVSLSSYIKNDALLDYLQTKINTLNIKSMHNTFDKVNCKYSYNLLSSNYFNNYITLSIQSIVEFNYADMLDLNSSISDVAKITVDASNGYIVNWYMQGDMYDETVIGNSENKLRSAASIEFTTTENIKHTQAELNKQNLDYYKNLFSTENIMPEESLDHKYAKLMGSLTLLDKSAIISWAKANAKKDYPTSGDGITPYYDFSNIDEAFDCTNFVSHALLAGGATPNTSSTGNSGWFFKSIAVGQRSTSWSGVEDLYEFLTRSETTTGPIGRGSPYAFILTTSANKPFAPGDVLQFKYDVDKKWRHSTIITAYYSPDGNHLGAVVYGRSGVRMSNINEKAEDIYAYARRVISLTYNYN